MSSWITGLSYTLPAGTCPGHFTKNGTRMPPSSVVRFEPRNGSLRDALIEVPGIVGPPLSLKKNTSVLSSRFLLVQRLSTLADRIVHRRHHAGVRAAILVFDVLELLEPIIGRVHRRVNGVEREIEEERLLRMMLDERDGFAAKRIGQIFLFLNRFVVAAKRRLRVGEITVRAAEKSERIFEAAVLRNKRQLAAQSATCRPSPFCSRRP